MRQFYLVFFLLPFFSFSQQDNVSVGGDVSGSGGSVSYSVGQVFNQYQSGSTGNLNQGVQQPYEIDVTLGSEHSNINLSCSVFPNPAQNFLILTSSFSPSMAYTANLFDAAGKLLSTTLIQSSKTEINLGPYSNGVYFLSVINNQETIKQFKIIKHH